MTIEAIERSKISNDHQDWRSKFALPLNMFRNTINDHLSIYLIAIFTLGLAFVVAYATKVSVDFNLITTFGYYLFAVVVAFALGFTVIKLCQLAFVEKSTQPTKELIQHLKLKFYNPQKIASATHLFIAFSIFACGFAFLRASVAVLNPFEWDTVFRDLDKLIHFGKLPHEFLGPILNNANLVVFFNFIYNCWYFLMLGSLATAAMLTSQRQARLQFINAFFLVWLVLGFFMATGFSSAGPCYFDRLGLGPDYDGLMASLNAANQTRSIWALPTQDLLWDGYIGARAGSVGITAFPSIHVATSVLIAIAATKVSVKWGAILWGYAGLIMLGSVVLGWHYAVDGYASALLVPLVWWVSDKLVPSSKA